MKIVISLLVAGLLVGCNSTGTIDPAVQAQLTTVEQLALQFAEQYAAQHLGTSINSSSTQASIANATAAIQVKAPKVPPKVIKDVVVAKHVEKLKK